MVAPVHNRPTSWFLAILIDGYDHPAFQTGHHVYIQYAGNGRYNVLGKCGVPLIMSESVAMRRVRRVREKGELVRVRQQERQSERFAENLSEFRRSRIAWECVSAIL